MPTRGLNEPQQALPPFLADGFGFDPKVSSYGLDIMQIRLGQAFNHRNLTPLVLAQPAAAGLGPCARGLPARLPTAS
jgi:hypothetical protein